MIAWVLALDLCYPHPFGKTWSCIILMHTLCVAGLRAGYEVLRPALTNNMKTTLKATVNSSRFNTCVSGFDGVTRTVFRIVYPLTSHDLCSIPFPDCDSSTVSEQGGHRCSCKTNSGPIWHYELDFFFNQSLYQGAKIIIETNCLKTYPLTEICCENLDGEYTPHVNF